jgi:hypothetical protein
MSRSAPRSWDTTKAIAVTAALSATACSLVIDSGQYVGGGDDAGMIDAPGLDAPGLDAPGLDAGPGGPPVLASVALDNYRPFVGETIRATAVGLADPGSAAIPTVRYQWLRDGTAIDGATTNVISTSMLPAGTALTLEAHAEDAEMLRSDTVTVGPIVLRPDVTAWRPLVPDAQSLGGALGVWDDRHERVVLVSLGITWEVVIDGTSLVARPLDPSGTAPPRIGRYFAMHDPERDRMLVVDASDLRNVYLLDLTQRGEETWTLVAASGAPTERVLTAHVYDPTRDVFWVYGGFDDGTGAFSDLLTLRSDGALWTAHPVSGPIGTLSGSTMAVDPTDPDRVLVFGGLDFAASPPGTSDVVYALDVSSDPVVSEQLVGLPERRFGSTAFVRESDILLLGGGSDFDTIATNIVRFDPSTGGSALMGTTTMPSVLGLVGRRSTQPPVWWAGLSTDGTTAAPNAALAVLEPDGTSRSVLVQVRPPALSETMGAGERTFFTLFGGASDGTASPLTWRYDYMTQRFSLVSTMPDLLAGSEPVARGGLVLEASGQQGMISVFGGIADGTILSGDVWSQTRGQWTLHALAAGAPAIEGRYGASAVRPRCGGAELLVVGGRTSSGLVVLDPRELNCDGGMRRNCAWDTIAPTGTSPAPRTFATAFTEWNRVYVFGGRSDLFEPLGDLVSFPGVCRGATGDFGTPVVTGELPSARWGHSATGIEDAPIPAVVLFGGRTDMADLDDAHVLVLRGGDDVLAAALEPLDVRPLARAHHAAFWDLSRARLVVYGGANQRAGDLGDLWELRVRFD